MVKTQRPEPASQSRSRWTPVQSGDASGVARSRRRPRSARPLALVANAAQADPRAFSSRRAPRDPRPGMRASASRQRNSSLSGVPSPIIGWCISPGARSGTQARVPVHIECVVGSATPGECVHENADWSSRADTRCPGSGLRLEAGVAGPGEGLRTDPGVSLDFAPHRGRAWCGSRP